MVNPVDQLGSGISALANDYHIIAHNLANINTAGYKRKVNSFTRELMKQVSDGPDGSVPEGEISINSVFDFSQGSLLKTNRSLDAAISGKGFFVVETPDGPLYTRSGMFQVNPQGQLVDLEGRMISGDGGPIVIPVDVSVQQVNIGEDGSVSTDGNSLGRLKVVDFKEDEEKLFPVGKNCFSVPEGVAPVAAEKALIKQGFQENSNVERMEEVVGMITVSRLYETNMKLLARRHENAKVLIGVANS
jgi:flagellar basal body rod protein FlgG